jgi:hypothetical protein
LHDGFELERHDDDPSPRKYAAVSPAVATIVAETALCVQFGRLDASGFELDISANDGARHAVTPIETPQPFIVVMTTLFGQMYKCKGTIALRPNQTAKTARSRPDLAQNPSDSKGS